MARLLALTIALLLSGPAFAADRTPAPPAAVVYFITPADGATISNPITVRFGLKGMGVAPAGVEKPNTGHHHLLIDTDVPADLNVPLPTSDNVRHYGKGQTEATIELKPGKHTLQLVLGDDKHTPLNPNVISKKITITVK